MTWPTASLSKTNVDADGDTVTGVGGGRNQLELAIDRLNTLAGEAVALLDEAGEFTALQQFTLQNYPIELRAATTDGVLLPFHASQSTPATRHGRIGFDAQAVDMVIENETALGVINFKTVGGAEVQVNGERVLDETDSTTPADGTITQAKLSTATGSLAANVSAGSNVNITLTAYCFWPMLHATDSSGSRMLIGGHTTDGNNSNLPRLRWHNFVFDALTAGTCSYDVNYRYVAA